MQLPEKRASDYRRCQKLRTLPHRESLFECSRKNHAPTSAAGSIGGPKLRSHTPKNLLPVVACRTQKRHRNSSLQNVETDGYAEHT